MKNSVINNREFKFSNPSKLNSKAFPIPVRDNTCLGRLDQKTGELLEKCLGCYADNRGFYAMPDTKQVREDNLSLFNEKPEEFVFWMIGKLNRMRNKEFRWFDSGDIFSIRFLKAVIEICEKTPDTTHWIPTTTWNYPNTKFLRLLQVLRKLPNVRLRASNRADKVEINKSLYPLQSVVVNKLEKSTKELFYCPASNQGGKCSNCRACYKESIQTIAYLKH